MKKVIVKKSFWQSLLSAIALGVFAYIAMATFGGISQQKYHLPDGRWEVSKHYSDGNTETTTGNVDGEGRWDGPVKVEYENDNYMLTHTEEVNMEEGKRHGISKVTYPSGYVATYCYQHGERVSKESCEKSAAIGAEDSSVYGIISYKKPWFVFKLQAFGYDTSYVKAYLDTLETILFTSEFDLEDFEEYYDDVVDDLGETAYDSIIAMNTQLLITNGLELILDHEFRLATIRSYTSGNNNTYEVVKRIYPYYLLTLNDFGVSDLDFENFCFEYDSIMLSYEPVSLDDPYFLDSLDARMFRAVEAISSDESKSANSLQALKATVKSNNFRDIWAIYSGNFVQLKNLIINNTSEDVAGVVLSTFLIKFIQGDLIRSATRDAFSIKNNLVQLATATTSFSSTNSSTSVSISGNVIEDGGGEVSVRGIVWDTIYNPTVDNQMQTMGSGTGDFMVPLTGLTQGVSYYARTFAMNSAGTSYGNCISFVTKNTTGVYDDNLNYLSLEVYPNPTSGNISIEINSNRSKDMIFTLFDLNGKVVFEKELTSIANGESRMNMNLSGLQNGLYMCRITSDNKIYASQKLLINH